MEAPLLVVGRIARPHGLRGEVSVVVVADDPERLSPGRELWFEPPAGPGRALRVASSRPQRERRLVRFEGITTREDAERLAGGDLSVPCDPAALGAGDYYPHQLEGLQVVTVAGAEVGRIAGVVFAAALPYLEVVQPARPGTRLVPFRAEVVRSVDLEARRVTIEPPEGLLDL